MGRREKGKIEGLEGGRRGLNVKEEPCGELAGGR